MKYRNVHLLLEAALITSAAFLSIAPSRASGLAHETTELFSGTAGLHRHRAVLSCSGSGWSISPCETSITVNTFQPDSVELDLLNSSGSSGTVAVTSDCSGSYFSACSGSPNNPTLAGDGQGVAVIFHLTAIAAGSQDVHVTVSGGSPTMVVTIHVTIASASHRLTADASMTNNDYFSPTVCAMACFSTRYTYSTVPFFVLDQPMGIMLVYDSEREFPRPFVFVDVHPDSSGIAVVRYALTATVNDTSVTFVNGDGTLYFSGASDTRRLTGQFATSLRTGVYPMTLRVVATYADSNTKDTTITTELMVSREEQSEIAKGWQVAGLEQLYFPSIGGYMIRDGDGTAVRFTRTGVTGPDYSVLSVSGGVYTRTFLDGSRAIFDSNGYETSFIDASGRTTTFLYDSIHRLVGVKNPMTDVGSGAPYDSLTYDSRGITAIIQKKAGVAQRTTSFTLNSTNCITGIQDPDGVSTYLTYNSSDRLASVTDRVGGETIYYYDALTWKHYAYQFPEVPVDLGGGSTFSSANVEHDTAWQSVGLPRVATNAGSPATPVIPDNVVGESEDAIIHRTHFTVNRYGQPLRVVDTLGNVTTFTRSGTLLTDVQHPDGSQDHYTWSGGLMTSEQLAGQPIVHYHYDSNNMVDSVWGSGFPRQRFFNNSTTRLVDSVAVGTSPALVTRYTYNTTVRRPRMVIDPNGSTIFTGYSDYGNVSADTAAGNRISTRIFDTNGRDSLVKSSGSGQSLTEYDLIDRPVAVYDTLGAKPTTFTYGTDDIVVVDPDSNSYRTMLDPFGKPTKRYDANTSSVYSTYRYDVAGRMTSATNRRGQRIDLTYDALDRPLVKSGTNTTSVTFGYSADGRNVVANTAVETDSIYSSAGSSSAAATDSTVTHIGGMRFRIFHYHGQRMSGVDSTSVLTSVSGLDIKTRKAIYNSEGRLDTLKIGTGHNIIVNRDADEELSKLTFGTVEDSYTNTVFTSARDRKSNKPELDTAFRRSYHYDSALRVDQMQNITTDLQWAYRYDPLGQLTGRENRSSCGSMTSDSLSQDGSGIGYSCTNLLSADTMTYDPAGNRTDHGISFTTGNRYLKFLGDTTVYDADGNVIQKYKPGVHNRVYYWSAANQLDSTMLDSYSMVRYDYNAFGKPVIKYRKIVGGSWSVDSYFIWDGEQLLLDLDASGHRISDYAYFPGTIDTPAAQTIGATSVTAIRDFQFDASGNVIGTVDGVHKSQVITYDSTAWGVPTIAGNGDNRLMWKALMWEGDAVSLYFNRNRWYDPYLGRFMSEDPIGHAGGKNLYAFGGNDPVNASDPSGMVQCSQELVEKGYHTSIDENGHAWCIPGGIGGGYPLPPVIVGAGPALPVIPPEPADPASPFGGFGGNGDFRGSGGGSSWSSPPRTCSASGNLGVPAGAYAGVSLSYFIGYGFTGAAGIVWDAGGPGIYVRAGWGVGLQGSAGIERGVVVGGMSGLGVEAEGAGAWHGASGSVGANGVSGSVGPRATALPLSGHVAVTYTNVWTPSNSCGQ
jgi:RHS repeat-associated protein